MTNSTNAVDIERIVSPTDEVCALVSELESELSRHYPAEQRHGLAIEAIFQPHIRFFVARVEGRAVGCGGVALFADCAELKRMYVRPDVRGQGVADAIMNQLASEAWNAGLAILRLETGIQQTAAINFYKRNGFAECPAFEPYASMPRHKVAGSVFMEKQIRRRSAEDKPV